MLYNFALNNKNKNKKKNKKNQQKKASKRKKQLAHQQRGSAKEEKEKETEKVDEQQIAPNVIEHETIAPDMHQYDYRCLRWFFDEDFLKRNNFDNEKLLKHTFDFACDYYIFNYGIPQDWHNETHPGQIDTAYYMGGEILYPDGSKKTVLFACTKDPAGICYHRGIQQKESSLFAEFEKNKFEYDFPAYYFEPESQEQRVELQINNELYSKTCFENQFYITIYDKTNKVTLILFKPNFN